ncbi:integral membrane sensor signal transduction histidine kinase : Sensor histidine kinase, putative OS=Thermodesulfovibrio yellowstonii (strain ATCC 51303 / DSM 11347 / YP87) GN=THEYE_A0751 PE=4 SV=1: HisKA: HATPase_c [Gemmataceae bacterium]|nr:integral membrane sensor signal transduction histidine kinase : Sensor histidine kinase, putative OS=Thermodesulfovibrio yellowstonii (strain ATCC 51303 / DSM 11347 / YP87) GN=THEYE_A0751 PE=4 SV=1: HisKA: HATPase_c [Gemmataceae bacterium]VTT97137.1 integral membrane sensor signal transduction histidine kinase : Sensor histidine kinase, putative OS=Thermodesulfovibrio yellowstonii (strain ATCC 51303 / DSM 11347 / YP87) GN=THEYE_A0751 PE=4 SV=1: HisKA: HATPase_c [Gemmataceae bacterium]
MRSIRRTLTLYLFALLAAALGVVWVVLDQATARVLDAREAADRALIGTRHEARCREERARVDQALLDQARLLGKIVQEREHERFDVERGRHRAAMGVVPLALGPLGLGSNPLAQAAWTATANYNPFPLGRTNGNFFVLFRTHFANLPIPDEYLHHFDDENRTIEFFQINTAAGREWRSSSLGTRRLPFDPADIDGRPADPARPPEGVSVPDWKIGNADLGPDKEPVRRVVYQMPHLNSSQGIGWFRGRGPGRDDRREDRKDDRPPGPGGPQRSMVGAFTSWALTGFGGAPPGGLGVPPPPTPSLESLPRLYVQCARPQSAIDAVIARFTDERDAELAQLAGEISEARSSVRAWAAGVGLAAFLAVAVGGPVLVGRGLVPVGKLSDAVSRVNEKDFKLDHDGTDLAAELVPIHARLTQTLDLLRRAFSREKQAVADISHELRTPIAALMATIDVSLRKPRTPEQYRATLEECRVISKQLGQLVERIMTLASLDAGNDRVMVARTDAADLAAGCVSVIRPLAAANNVTVALRAGDPADLELDTDAGKLREVLMNLLHNAVEYNAPGGTIELTAARSLDAVVLEVRDTGIGMSAEVREKIFERFYRADPSRHATGVHAGLGLAIVKEYVSRLGGTITVESEEGKGSTFRVTLPVPAAIPDAAAPADEPLTAGV